jgi:hypothetical protein
VSSKRRGRTSKSRLTLSCKYVYGQHTPIIQRTELWLYVQMQINIFIYFFFIYKFCFCVWGSVKHLAERSVNLQLLLKIWSIWSYFPFSLLHRSLNVSTARYHSFEAQVVESVFNFWLIRRWEEQRMAVWRERENRSHGMVSTGLHRPDHRPTWRQQRSRVRLMIIVETSHNITRLSSIRLNCPLTINKVISQSQVN